MAQIRVNAEWRGIGLARARSRRVWLAWPSWLTLSRGDSAASRQVAVKREVERWFTEYQRPVLEYLYGMTRDREWAADLTQDTFLRAYAALSREATDITRPQAWLLRIATNVAISSLRRKRRFLWLPLSVVEPEPDDSGRWRAEPSAIHSEDIAATVVERDAVWAALAQTPPRWRAALLLQTVGGLTSREIATELGVSEANARKMLFRAKERFRQIMARDAATAKEGAP
ncbi:MAG TPA: RNA polymerase sigma factor [Ktedonobacterales bacterium]